MFLAGDICYKLGGKKKKVICATRHYFFEETDQIFFTKKNYAKPKLIINQGNVLLSVQIVRLALDQCQACSKKIIICIEKENYVTVTHSHAI